MSPRGESSPAVATLSVLRRLARNLPWLVGVPALLVAAAVSYGVGRTIIYDFGRMVAAGHSGFTAEYVQASKKGEDLEAAGKKLRTAVDMRIQQGSMTSFALLDPKGGPMFETGEDVIRGFSPAEISAARSGKTTSRLEGSGQAAQAYVASPISVGGKPSDFVVLVVRPAETVGSSVRIAVLSVLATVLSGALITYLSLMWLLRRSAREIEQGLVALDRVERRLEYSLADLESHSVGTLLALTQAVDAKDSYTAAHSVNVADYASALAKVMGRSDLETQVERAGLVHDIGKIGTPEELLLKPGGLTPDEFEVVKRHSADGATIITSIPFLSDVVDAVRAHHERWDGGGYPDGRAGDGIPLSARILAVADAFDAMTSNRPYRKAMPVGEALEEIRRYSGSQFDPDCAAMFVEGVRSGVIPVTAN